MAHVIADRVLESSTTAGTGVFTLAGAVLGFRAFTAVCAVSDTVPYYIEAVDDTGRPTGEYEYGLGTYSAANQLTRTTVRGSSNGGLAVSFGAGTKLVGLGVPAPNSSATRTEWRQALGFSAFGETLVTAANSPAVQALLPVNQVRVDVASAATVNLTSSAPNSDHINITGGVTINGFTIAAGRLIFARFNASLTLTNGASLVTQTGANIVTQAGDTCIMRATAANVVEVLCYTSLSKVNLGASVATTSGTAIDFTGIPSWVNRVTMLLNGVSTNGTANLRIQLGTSGGPVTSGYVSTATRIGSSVSVPVSGTAGFTIVTISAAGALSGRIVFERQSGNNWVASGAFSDGTQSYLTEGCVPLPGVLDRVRFTTANGADAFDLGSASLSWE